MKGENIFREIFDSLKRHIILLVAIFLIGNFIYLGNPGEWIRGIFGNPDVYIEIEDPDSALLGELLDVDAFSDQWKLHQGSIYQENNYMDPSSGITLDLAEQWMDGKCLNNKIALEQRIMYFQSEDDLAAYTAYWENYFGHNEDTIIVDIASTVSIPDDVAVDCSIDSFSYDNKTYYRTSCSLQKSSDRRVEIVTLQANDKISNEDLFNMVDDLVVLMQ